MARVFMARLKRCFAAAMILALMLGACMPAQADEERPYYITVDLTNQIVTIYRVADNTVARQMICSTGLHGSTPVGTFYMTKIWNMGYDRKDRTEWHYFDAYKCYAKWASRIVNDILFHSVIYDDKHTVDKKSIQMLGSKASHGCIRLREEDAEFIAKNCLSNTKVTIFESGETNESLRVLLKSSSYTGQDGMSYEDFCAYSETGLGAGAQGEEVSSLQYRLLDLGFFKGSVNGTYDLKTIEAVRALQNALGVHPSGTVEQELSEIIFSDDAPLSTEMVALEDGRSGPAVRKFQTALQKLGFYTEDIDAIYDVGVIEAVKEFQRTCGYPEDGIASPEIQHLAYFELDKIQRVLGTEDFQREVVEEPIIMGTIESKYRVNVREKASQKSRQLGQLTSGFEVMVFGTEGDWAKIYVNGVTCYVLRNCVQTREGTNTYMRYSANGNSVTLGSSWAELESGTGKSAAQELRDYYAEHQNFDYLGEEEEYVTVNTGDQGVSLNLRSDASGDSEVLAQLPNGTSLRVLSRGEEWTSVSYDDQIGYLMNQYLSFEDGSEPVQLNTVDAYEESEIVTVSAADGSGKANVYAEADESSTVVATLDNNTQLDLIALNEGTGWAQISSNGIEGYIQGANLSFSMGEA